MLSISASAATIFFVVITISAIVQALTGFGFALCALSLLACWMDVREAAILLCPAGLLVNAILFFRLRAHFSWEGLRPLLAASLAGLPLGTFLLLRTSPRILEMLLAGLMIFAAVQGFVGARSRANPSVWGAWSAGLPCGFLGGVLSGAFGTGGPPIVSYLLNRNLNRFRYIASTQALLGIVSSVRVAQFLYLGRMNAQQAPLLLSSFLAVIAGTAIGLSLLERFSESTARRAVLWFLVVSAISHLVRA